MQAFRLIAAIMLMNFAGFCWAEEESLIDLKFEATEENTESATTTLGSAAPPKASVARHTSNCTVVINPPNDSRRNKETLGTTFRDNPIVSKPPMVDWLQDALFNMKTLGINTVLATGESPAPSPDVIYVSTELDKAYVWFLSLNIHGTVVVKAKMRSADGAEVQHKYRVISTKANWAGADSEFVTTLNMAATRLVKQMATDIDAQCKGVVTVGDSSLVH